MYVIITKIDNTVFYAYDSLLCKLEITMDMCLKHFAFEEERFIESEDEEIGEEYKLYYACPAIESLEYEHLEILIEQEHVENGKLVDIRKIDHLITAENRIKFAPFVNNN